MQSHVFSDNPSFLLADFPIAKPDVFLRGWLVVKADKENHASPTYYYARLHVIINQVR